MGILSTLKGWYNKVKPRNNQYKQLAGSRPVPPVFSSSAKKEPPKKVPPQSGELQGLIYKKADSSSDYGTSAPRHG